MDEAFATAICMAREYNTIFSLQVQVTQVAPLSALPLAWEEGLRDILLACKMKIQAQVDHYSTENSHHTWAPIRRIE
jgi:hypothetical protein